MNQPRMADHESHLLGRYCVCCDYEISLIFAVRGIEDNDEFSIF